MAAKGGGLYFMFLGPLSKVSGSATGETMVPFFSLPWIRYWDFLGPRINDYSRCGGVCLLGGGGG